LRFILLLPTLLLTMLPNDGPTYWLRFDNDEVQQSPLGFTTAVTGVGEPARWYVVRDETAPSQPNALAQPETEAIENRYPLCVFDGVTVKNLSCVASIKIVSGHEDMSGGIVCRYLDKDNYYVAGVGAYGAIFVGKVERGKLTVLGSTGGGRYSSKTLKLGAWVRLQVMCIDNFILVYQNLSKRFQIHDKTFPGAGKVGLWTKSGSYVHFDDMYVEVAR
jgi:hypothetical protein